MKTTVLVIDDEEAIRGSLRMILEYEGYRFVEAGSGQAGLKAVEAEKPDAVLLDIKMPRMDGLEVLPILRERVPDLPVLVISGDRKSTRLNSSHLGISYAVFCLKKKKE